MKRGELNRSPIISPNAVANITTGTNNITTKSFANTIATGSTKATAAPTAACRSNATSTTPTAATTTATASIDAPKTPTTTLSHLARIRRDFDSPSALIRMRAIKALRSPTHTPYSTYDIPHEEENIITEEERLAPPKVAPASMEDLMKDIVVYVEVRSGEDNRSWGVKKVIAMLGAKVNDKLLRDTTHVVFKDGLLSTYKKAKNWNIPVVSILWIEACKTQRCICDPKDYPISNIDRYENPELYEKMKRHKWMQPNSECNKRLRNKTTVTLSAISKDLIAKTGNDPVQKLTKSFSDNSTSKNKQTDISKFFNPVSKETQKAPSESAITDPHRITSNAFSFESPATQLLNRIHSESYTPLLSDILKKPAASDEICNNGCIFETNPGTVIARRALDYDADENAAEPNAKKKRNATRRRSILTAPKLKKSPNMETPQRITRRRSTLLACSVPNLNKKSSIKRQAIFLKSDNKTNSDNSPSPETVKTKQKEKYNKSPVKAKVSDKRVKDKTVDSSPIRTIRKEVTSPIIKGKAPDTPRGGKNNASETTPRVNKISPNSPIKVNTLNTPRAKDNKVSPLRHSPTKVIAEETPRSKDKISLNSPTKVANASNKNKINRKLFDHAHDSSNIAEETPKQREIGRHTIYTNKTIDMSAERKTPATKPPIIANRRTLYTPQAMEISSNGTVIEKSLQSNKNTPVRISDKLNEFKTTPRQEGGASLLEEHSKALTFSSTRPPNRRRTIFDVQMDIVSLRLQNINNATKQNAALSSTAIDNENNNHHNNNDDIVERNKDEDALKNKQNVDGSISEQNKNKTNDTTNQADQQVNGALVKSPNAANKINSIKKRKLYVPDESALTINSTESEKPKRRRTLAPSIYYGRFASPTKKAESKKLTTSTSNSDVKNANTTQTNAPAQENKIESTTQTIATTSEIETSDAVKTTKTRRIKRINSKSPEKINLTDDNDEKDTDLNKESKEGDAVNAIKEQQTNESGSGVEEIQVVEEEEENKKVEKKLSEKTTTKKKSKSKINKKASETETKTEKSKVKLCENEVNEKEDENVVKEEVKKIPFLVCTNMSKENIFMAVEAIETLGGFRLANTVDENTTHVVSSEPRRTLNLMRALLRGLWILSFEWITASMKAGRWVDEEPYEMRALSRAVEICRAERQAFGDSYRCDLFRNLGSFYVSSRCDIITKENVQELIELCGGRVIDTRKHAKYIIGDWNRSAMENKIFVSPFWILDSITHMQVLKYHRYTYRTNRKKLSILD